MVSIDSIEMPLHQKLDEQNKSHASREKLDCILPPDLGPLRHGTQKAWTYQPSSCPTTQRGVKLEEEHQSDHQIQIKRKGKDRKRKSGKGCARSY